MTTARAETLPLFPEETVGESYEERGGHILRTVRAGRLSFRTRIEDRAERCTADRSGHPRDPARSRWWRSWLLGARPEPEDAPAGSLSIVDLFCGCGGLSLGAVEAARALGFEPVVRLAVDVDGEALAVYARHLGPERTLVADVSQLATYEVRGWRRAGRLARALPSHETLRALRGRVDLVVAGPPCQGHSNLNNRTRRYDPRNLLLLDAVAVAVSVEAKATVLENVPAIVHDRTGVLETALSVLEDAGYRTTCGVLAADALGLAQTRRRFFLVASRTDPVPLREVARGMAAEPATVRWAIGDLVDRQLDPVMDRPAELSAENRARIDHLFENDLYDLPDALRPACHRDGHTYPSVYGRLHWDLPAGTITTGFSSPGRGRFVHPSRRRTLTPREAARLQGFPDWFDFRPAPNVAPSRADVARWIGNAVPPILGYAATIAAITTLVVDRKDRGQI